MRKKTRSFLCFGILATLLLPPINTQAKDEILYPATIEIREQEKWQTPNGIETEEFEEQCDSAFTNALGSSMAGGAIAVVSHGKVVFSKGYGYADMEEEIPFSPSKTIFEYGSVSKLFTWTSAMQMKEQGKLDLQENIDSYIMSDFQRVDETKNPVTMLHLMNHQAGYDDYLIHLMSRQGDLIPLKEALEEHKVSQIHEPGFATSYSNYGAALAGYVVENIVGEPFYQYVEDNIFAPLQMTNAKMNPGLCEDYESQKSKAYVVKKDGLAEGSWSYIPMYPAGSINGTVEDLAKFAIAYLEESPVLFKEKETYDEMLSASYEIAPGVEGIAHGFIEFDGEYPVYWHNGQTENFSTFFAIVPKADFAILACGNTEQSIETIQTFCFSMLQKKEVKLQTAQDNLPDISFLEGNYKDFREAHRGILKIISLFRRPVHVEVTGNNEISIDGEQYVQIEPYVFQSLENGRKCGFLVEDGKVLKISQMLDYLPVPWTVQVRDFFTCSVVILFLVSFVMTWIRFIVDIIQKRKNLMHKLFLLENGILAAIVADLCMIVGKIADWSRAEEFAGFRIANLSMSIVLSIVILAGMVKTKGEARKGNCLYRGYSILLFLVLVVLAWWGFFSVFG